LQCVAVCCSVLQCVAVCCSVLQCVAVTGITCHILVMHMLQSVGLFTLLRWIPEIRAGVILMRTFDHAK